MSLSRVLKTLSFDLLAKYWKIFCFQGITTMVVNAVDKTKIDIKTHTQIFLSRLKLTLRQVTTK